MREDIKKRLKQVQTGIIPEGYTKMQRGIFPHNWKQYNIKDMFSKVRNPVGIEPETAYVQIGIRSHGKGLFHKEPVTGKELGEKAVFWIEPDCFVVNIVFAWEQAIGKTTKKEVGCIASHRFPMYRPLENKVDLDYILRFFMTKRGKEILEEASPGGAGRNKTLGQDRFAKSLIILPSFSEQQKISEILNHCDKVIELKQQLIEEERNRKKWLMQNLLDPNSGVRVLGFNDQWSTIPMGELFEFGSSLSASRADLGSEGICYLHYGDIHSNDSAVVDVQANFNSIPKLSTTNSIKYLLRHGDVVFVDASEDYEGASKYVVVANPKEIPFLAGLHTIPAKSKSDALDIDYKKYCFQSYNFKKQVAFYVSGMKVYGLNKDNLAKIIIFHPTLPEQRTIAKIMMSVDKEIILLEQELSEWKKKKKALMQLLLTGFVRVEV